ncbi:MAG: radical SAM protein, partial [Candidatus Fimadaptatus sp.]|nr:radical SAM protein [Candidatus Fimadaptatus sp.]
MADMTMTETIKAYGLKKMIKYLDDNPDENIPKLMDWMEKLDKKFHIVPGQVAAFRNVVDNPDGNWYKLLKSVWTDLDPKVRHALFENFIINATIIGGQRQDKVRAEHNCNVPWAILMDPTSACNLHCTGCWAAEYGNKLNLSLDTLESIIQQGTAMGTFMYIYSGGEPLVRKKDIITLCERHPDCMFLAFTNATLIDEEFAQDMLRVGNFVPAISVEGFEEATDFRRGDGTFKAVMKAMEILKRNKLLFGASVCYTSKNTDVIGSDEYIDAMINWGCKFAWFFTYMPVGTDAVPELMVNAEQRKFMYRKVRQWRKTKPLFTLDFWNDG